MPHFAAWEFDVVERLEERTPLAVSDESVQQMLLLAERLRESRGGELDDDAIVAVSEACGLPVDYVRASVGRLPETKTNRGFIAQLRHAILALDPDVRRHVASGFIAVNIGLLNVLAGRFGDQYGLMGVTAMLLMALAVWNFSVCRKPVTAMITGAIFGGLFFVSRSLFMLAVQSKDTVHSAVLIPFVLFGGLGAVAMQSVVAKLKSMLGMKDPLQERQELLKQLVDLQDKLRSGEQAMTFLSLDVVGSTKMKQLADPLNVEYTFTEYHNWVEWVVQRYNGKVHSTAGDGITCKFDHPQHAYAAARYIQTGIVELNTFRNKIGVPITLRAGIHHGVVNAPAGEDITKINFASVIDIAAHMQKVAPAGGIAVSKEAAQYVPGGAAAIGSNVVEISGVQGFVWQPRVVAAPSNGGPPPLPAN